MFFELELFKLFALVLVRVSGLMVSAPVLGSSNFPLVAKIGLTAGTAALITPVLPVLDTPLPTDVLAFATMAIGEFIIGLILGFVISILFAAVQVGGQIMDLQTGFGMMNVFNPAMETQFPIFGFFLVIVAVLYLLVINGHQMMLLALARTYDHVDIGGFVVRPEMMWEISTWGTSMFVDGVMIAAPVATAMMLAYVSMGLLGRLVPQIHLFVIGFPVTIATGLFLAAAILGIYISVLDGMFERLEEHMGILIRNMGGA